MPRSHIEVFTHIVCSTWLREPTISAEVRPVLHRYLGGVIRNLKCGPVAIGGVADHVHLLVWLKAEVSVSALVRTMKSNSARWIHETFPELRTFAWQDGYAAFSVSPTRVGDVVRYVLNQEEHHRTRTVDDELQELVERSGTRVFRVS